MVSIFKNWKLNRRYDKVYRWINNNCNCYETKWFMINLLNHEYNNIVHSEIKKYLSYNGSFKLFNKWNHKDTIYNELYNQLASDYGKDIISLNFSVNDFKKLEVKLNFIKDKVHKSIDLLYNKKINGI